MAQEAPAPVDGLAPPIMGEFAALDFQQLQKRDVKRRRAKRRTGMDGTNRRRRVLRDVDVFEYETLAANEALAVRIDALLQRPAPCETARLKDVEVVDAEVDSDATLRPDLLRWYTSRCKRQDAAPPLDRAFAEKLATDALADGSIVDETAHHAASLMLTPLRQRGEITESEYGALLHERRQRREQEQRAQQAPVHTPLEAAAEEEEEEEEEMSLSEGGEGDDVERRHGVLISSKRGRIRIKMDRENSHKRRKRQRVRQGVRQSGDVRCPGEKMPFSGTEFDAPPASPVGIMLRAADYKPSFFYVGGPCYRRAAVSGRNAASAGAGAAVLSKYGLDSDTESEELVSLAARYSIAREGVELWAPIDCFTKFQAAEDTRFDTPLALDVGGMPRDDLQPLDATTTTITTTIAPKAAAAADVDATPVDFSPTKGTEKDQQRESRSRERQWKRVWANMIKKEMPREQRRFAARAVASVNHFRRISFIVAKEVRKNALKTQRGLREVPLRARRLVREMQNYWRRYDKDLLERQRLEEKEELDRIKAEDEKREAQRQSRKLEFLLTQTELFSHFIGKKMGIIPAEQQQPTPAAAPVDAPAPAPAPVAVADERHDDAMQVVDEKAEEDLKLRHEAELAMRQHVMETRDKARLFDETSHGASSRAMPSVADQQLLPPEQQQQRRLEDDDVDLLHPSTMPSESHVSEPKLFKGKLKPYQLKGLNWLVNLYEQGINGILADEMGLGKTIQSICFVAHLCEVKNIWGPFVVVAPNSTLHQWKQELHKFCPQLKVIPYWGSQKDRSIIRKFWKTKQLGTRDAPFHVCVTSYSVFVNDEKQFQRLKWQYMILDEAQAIKNSNSQRWTKLLGLKCRNRLLLTGTPIQNSMAELWALLHFIMPTLFDSHEEFNEWFSRDIESHAGTNTGPAPAAAAASSGRLDLHQLKRLHMILQPFMLRRVKHDVEHEMAAKIEVQLNCELSQRQRVLYRALKDRVSFSELADPTLSSKENLMNLVMQFRKVCNHPEVFERSVAVSPLQWSDPAYAYRDASSTSKRGQLLDGSAAHPHVVCVSHNPIRLLLPRCLHPHDASFALSPPLTPSALLLWSPSHVHRLTSTFGFAPLLHDLSVSDVTFAFWSQLSPVHRWLLIVAHRFVRQRRAEAQQHGLFPLPPGRAPSLLLVETDVRHAVLRRLVVDVVHGHALGLIRTLLPLIRVPCDAVSAPPIDIVAHSRRALVRQQQLADAHWERSVLSGADCRSLALSGGSADDVVFALPSGVNVPPFLFDTVCPAAFVGDDHPKQRQQRVVLPGLCSQHFSIVGAPSAQLFVPHLGKLIADSGKMLVLDRLLQRLKAEGHRVLIFSQMRKMIDILQDYMQYRNYRVFRLDGGTDLADRRDMVNEFQSSDRVFAFLLSTRAGGLGITLTAADTVIFYDNDWNPTMDAQAMDRVHRIGQTKQVTVYRLVCRGTVEERILKRARAKFEIQNTVYSGGFKLQKTSDVDLFKRNELKEFLLDDE